MAGESVDFLAVDQNLQPLHLGTLASSVLRWSPRPFVRFEFLRVWRSPALRKNRRWLCRQEHVEGKQRRHRAAVCATRGPPGRPARVFKTCLARGVGSIASGRSMVTGIREPSRAADQNMLASSPGFAARSGEVCVKFTASLLRCLFAEGFGLIDVGDADPGSRCAAR